MSYGFTVSANEDIVAAMNRITKAVAEMKGQVESATKDVQQDFKEMGESAREVGRMIGEVFAVREVYEFGKELMHITAEFESFQNVIKYSSRSAIDAEDNMTYLEGAIRRLHMPMREAYQGFSEMQAGLIGTGVEGERLRKLFEGISTAASVLHLPAHNLEMVLYDFKEIGERGLNMRNMRSLMGWLPGISEIVKETFHKTFEELEKEHMTGPNFLNALAGGLQKHFAPGLGNAGNSLQASINDTTTALTKLEREMGEKLRPLFMEIMRNIRQAFDSDIVRSFVNNIRPIAEGLITMVKLWLEYKAGIYAVKLIEEARIAVLSAMALAQGKLTLETEAGAVSLKSFQEGMNNFSTGLFAMGIGAAIEILMKFNAIAKQAKKETEDLLESDSHAGEIGGKEADIDKQISKFKADLGSPEMASKKYRDDLYQEIQNQISQVKALQTETINPGITRMQSLIKESWNPDPKDVKSWQGSLAADQGLLKNSMTQLGTLQQLLAEIKKAGGKTPTYTGFGGDNLTGGALSTVGLTGAQGGLGQAKEIHIHIDTMQKVSVGTPDGLKRAGQDAVEVMLRALNNVAYGQSRTQ